MLPAGGRQHRRCIITTNCNTQSSAPEDGQNNCPKLVELTGIINKPLLLHLVGCLYYLYQWRTVKQILDNEIYLLIKYIKSVLWRVSKCLSYIEEARCLRVNVNFNVFLKLIKVHLLARELYIYQNARCNNKKKTQPIPTSNSHQFISLPRHWLQRPL